MNPLTTPVLQARDIILAVCRHRINLTLTEAVARDLANNAAQALTALLEDLQRGLVSDDPPPVRPRLCPLTPDCGLFAGHEGECQPPAF